MVTRLNETILQQLAASTKGIYIRLDDVPDAVAKISAQLDTIEKSPLDDAAFRDYDTYYYWFIGLALFLIIAEMLWPERNWKIA